MSLSRRDLGTDLGDSSVKRMRYYAGRGAADGHSVTIAVVVEVVVVMAWQWLSACGAETGKGDIRANAWQAVLSTLRFTRYFQLYNHTLGPAKISVCGGPGARLASLYPRQHNDILSVCIAHAICRHSFKDRHLDVMGWPASPKDLR